MIRTGTQYRDSIRDGRQVWVNGERVKDVTTHPMFKPLVDIRARMYDMQHESALRDTLTYDEGDGERHAIAYKLPLTRQDWWDKRRATDLVLEDMGGVVTRVGDETVGEMWSLFDGQDVLAELDPRFSANMRTHIHRVVHGDVFHVSANTDPKGDRSKLPQQQNPDVLLHVVKETDAGVIVRGAKYETAAAYANQAFTKPALANWGNDEQSEYAIGFICDLSAPNLRFICRTGFAGRASKEDYPLSNRFDEIDTIVVFDDVLIPWENVLFYRHTKAAKFLQNTLHRYSAFAFVQRGLKFADMLIGTALFNTRQTGVEKIQAVQDKLAKLACYREGINAHLTASIALAERSPAGLMMPNQSLLYTGRVLATSQLHEMMNTVRDLCGGQICLTPDHADFQNEETRPWLEKFYTLGDQWQADDRRKLLAYARDLLNSDYASHRLTFQMFAQSPPYAQMAAVYQHFDWDAPLEFVGKSAGLSDRVKGLEDQSPEGDSAVSQWFRANAAQD